MDVVGLLLFGRIVIAMKILDQIFKNAEKIGGNAVIYASFEYRISVTGKAPNIERVKELFCCGTAVQIAH